MDRFSRIEIFVRVVEHGSFSRAAEAIGITKSAVSKHVQALEDSLSVRLLNRTTRKLHLTEAGEEFFSRCTGIIENLEEAENLVRDMSHTPKGRLRVCSPLAFGTMHLSPAIADFVLDYPEINVELDLDGGTVDMVNSGFDLVVHVGKLADSSLIARKICDCEMKMVTSPCYIKKHGEPKTIDNLAKQKHLEFSKRQPTRGEWSYESENESGKMKINEVFSASNGQALVEAAKRGIGIASLPTYVCADELKDGSLLQIMPQYNFNAGMAVYAIFPHRNNMSTKVRLFIEHLAKRFDGQNW